MLHPLNDWLLVELEPEKETTGFGLIKVADDPIRTGCVCAVGPGKWYPEKFVPTEVLVGQRVAFFIAGTQTKVGQQLGRHTLPDNQVLIRETDVLLVIEGKHEVSV